MINIRPLSDLRNKYPEIEEIVITEDEPIYLTKNGYGSMVVMSIERYSKMTDRVGSRRTLENKLNKKIIANTNEEE